MRVKRYVADSMQEAISRVKADFGKDAVILHTKRLRRGGLFGLLGRTKVEVIAAAEGKRSRSEQESRPAASGANLHAQLDNAATRELLEVRRELQEIRKVLERAEDRSAQDEPAIQHLRERLLEQDVHPDLVRELLAVLRAKAEDGEMEEAWLERAARAEIARGIASADPWQSVEGTKVQCLVGPTGVGKTTTIAKLAANYSLLAGKRVALITVDTYRIAAVDQLKTYAEIIGVPLDVAFTPQELKDAIEHRSEYDLILVDTAGRSQKHKMQMQELRAFMDVIPDAQIHLVLSATTRLKDMLDVIERFGQLAIDYLIITKLDETSTFGALYNACRLTGKPLSYVTNGQTVPDDIEVADGDRIADMILGVSS
jgi:flagellar biosynthetic protein FlhF